MAKMVKQTRLNFNVIFALPVVILFRLSHLTLHFSRFAMTVDIAASSDMTLCSPFTGVADEHVFINQLE